MRPYRGMTKDGKWVYGWYKYDEYYDIHTIDVFESHPELETGHLFNEYLVIPETVGQFTGLKDKNGKDLDWWKGDIIKFEFEHGFIEALETKKVIGKIVYVDGCFVLESKNSYYHLSDVISCWHKKLGTIHENPKLLKD